ncbi:hypothetical protein [Massilia sp. H6]|uniref:hypothetical protein n=1 Tax=Massilia sp. H6 TaxID=2970464 RepID=UPI0021697EFA|nr:hypothetical protein [Massilia sp. H6]UVW27830.1 hypothetical protein NRS07_14935 [Massilia sp. H6]
MPRIAPSSQRIRYTSTGPAAVIKPAPCPPLQPCACAIFSTVLDETPMRNGTRSIGAPPGSVKAGAAGMARTTSVAGAAGIWLGSREQPLNHTAVDAATNASACFIVRSPVDT